MQININYKRCPVSFIFARHRAPFIPLIVSEGELSKFLFEMWQCIVGSFSVQNSILLNIIYYLTNVKCHLTIQIVVKKKNSLDIIEFCITGAGFFTLPQRSQKIMLAIFYLSAYNCTGNFFFIQETSFSYLKYFICLLQL